MRANEFNNFMDFMKRDLKIAECAGFAFLQLTDKQTKKVIDFYDALGMVDYGSTYIKFGSNLQLSVTRTYYDEKLKNY